MVLSFKSGDETLVCDHSNGSYRVVNNAVQGGSNFEIYARKYLHVVLVLMGARLEGSMIYRAVDFRKKS